MGSPGGIAMEIPVSDAAAAFRTPPRRLRRRLVESRSPSTVQDIEAKLRDADLRRQQFYEKLSRKARSKQKSFSSTSNQEEDLGQRLEARLQAAEQKRMSILANAQMRLARLDELRQAAKNGVELRFQKEREKLGSKVRSRFQQAEANRMLILKAHRQRRATLKERSSQSILRRVARESKYKECIRAAIHQKRAAAEKKRLGLLEAEKKKARARVLQVQQVATSVSLQRETERRRLRDQLEDRLQRARSQRNELLRQRGRMQNNFRVNWHKMDKQADLLSRKLARCWRQFRSQRRTTFDLARTYEALKINEKSVKSMPFEQLALLIESSATLQTVKAFLDRLESRLKVTRVVSVINYPSNFENIDHLLKRVATPKRRATRRASVRGREGKKVGLVREIARSPAKVSRYPVRVFLCAYMIVGHPDAVLSGQGESEIALAKSAEVFVQEFELLLKIILEGHVQSSDEESSSILPKRCTFRSQLSAFDKAWCSYLNCFVIWKVKDAQLLEEDLVRAACQLELSMIQTCKLTPDGESGALTHDMKAIQKQVTEDQKLLREKVHHLSGHAGIERMESALSETRSRYFQAKESGSPFGSAIMQILSPSSPSSSSVSSISRQQDEDSKRPSHVVRALFRDNDPPQYKGLDFSASGGMADGQPISSVEQLFTENEIIVNAFLHEQNYSLADGVNVNDEPQNGIKENIKRTMEKAFWDGVIESLKQDEPNFDRIMQLTKEVRDEICEIAPESWKDEIVEAIDIDIVSQVLKSGNVDIDYLGRILEFLLDTLQKLSSPAREDEMKATCQKLLKELAQICKAADKSRHSHVIAMVEGLRFVLEEIQVLKQDIKKARIRIMEPLLRGPAAFEYLREAFAKHYGPSSAACTHLPLTAQWLSSLRNCKDQEWEEHSSYLSSLPVNGGPSHQSFFPSTSLKAGGSLGAKSYGNLSSPMAENAAGQQQPGCNGEKVDLLVRLGLLKLVSCVSGLTQQALPETFKLNLSRLRDVQAQIQKFIVISTSILVFRQMLINERVVSSHLDMETILTKCAEHLVELVDSIEDVGIQQIVETGSKFLTDNLEVVDVERLQSTKAIMARTLTNSLQAGDTIFQKVSNAVYLSVRGIVLGGSGPHGRKMTELALRRIGAAMLTERVVKTAEVLVLAATVSVRIHGPWYTCLTSDF